MASQDRKWRHHYVPQHYLKAWAGSDNKLWCEEGGVYARETTKAIAYTRDFYRLQDIPDEQMVFVEGLIDRMGEPYRTLARGWIPLFLGVFRLERLYLASGKHDPAIERELDVQMSNLEENLHGRYENAAVGPLAKLRAGDATPFQDDEAFTDFSMYLGLQYFRTPRLLHAVVGVGRELGVDLAAAWGLLRTIFATNISGALYRERKTFRSVFLVPGPKSEFITGDQPMLNLGGEEFLDLYYPLGPGRALRLVPGHANPGVDAKSLTDDETQEYNRMIASAAEVQIYGASKEALSASRQTS